MPRIIPIRDLKNTVEISELCQREGQPIFVTKNGYEDMVIMSMETFERTMFRNDIIAKVEAAERSIAAGRIYDPFDSIAELRREYGL